MNALEKIEKLEQELAELKAELQVQEFAYPLFKRNNELVVRFTGVTTGEVVFADSYYRVGRMHDNWREHTNPHWEDVAYDKERNLFDGQLVWAWNDDWGCKKDARFYDAKNKRALHNDGERYGYAYDHYAQFEGEWPEWAVEAYKQLKF